MAGRWRDRQHTFAGMSYDAMRARFLCMMEAAERRSGLSADVMVALSFPHQVRDPRRYIHWTAFSPYDDALLAAYPDTGEPDWRVSAVGLLSGAHFSVPAVSVFPWWRSFSQRRALLPEGEGGGFAAGFTWEVPKMIERALREVVERDALMLSWRVPLWPVRRLSSSLLAERFHQYARRCGLNFELYDVGDPALAPVVMAVLSRDGSEAVLGASCHDDLVCASAKAACEAVMLRGTAELLDRVTPPLMKDDIADSASHIVHSWRDSGPLLAWYRSAADRGSATSPAPPSGDIRTLSQRCFDVFRAEPLLVDVTHPALTEYNIRVVRVLQPNAYRKEYRHVLRYLGGQRLRHLGVSPRELNQNPHAVG